MKILFVCLGNICRSPMAEGIFKTLVDANYHVESRATGTWEHGNPIHKGTKTVLENLGITMDSKKSQTISLSDYNTFDLILGMDAQNVADLKKNAPYGTEHKIHLFMELVHGKETLSVPDPWYTGDFIETRDLIIEGSKAWIRKLEQ